MALSNRDRVSRAFEALAAGLGPYVDRRMRSTGRTDWAPSQDPALLLRAMVDAWDRAFASELGKSERNVVFELRDWRNRWPTTTPSASTTPTGPSTPSSDSSWRPTPGKPPRSERPRAS